MCYVLALLMMHVEGGPLHTHNKNIMVPKLPAQRYEQCNCKNQCLKTLWNFAGF